MAGTSLAYLPDGQQILFPDDPNFYGEGDRIPAWRMTHDLGQLGFYIAQRPFFQGLSTTVISIGTSGWAALDLPTEMIDNYNMHSTTTNVYQVVPPETGNEDRYHLDDTYLCIGYVPQNSNSTTASFIAGIFDNQSVLTREGMKTTSTTGHGVTSMVVELIRLAGNPFGAPAIFVELAGWQNTGASVNTIVSSKCPSFTVANTGADRSFGSQFAPAVTPTIGPNDQLTADATGASPAGGVKVPVNHYVFDPVVYLTSPAQAKTTSQGSTQTFTNLTGVFTSIQMPTRDLDTFAMWSSGSNTKLTATRNGLFFIYGLAAVIETATKTGYRAVQILHTAFSGGATTVYGGNSTQCGTGAGTTGTALPACDLIQMSIGDTVELQFAHTNSSTMTVQTGTGNNSRLIALWTSG